MHNTAAAKPIPPAQAFVWPTLPSARDVKEPPLQSKLNATFTINGKQVQLSLSNGQLHEAANFSIGFKTPHGLAHISCQRKTFDHCVTFLFPDAAIPRDLTPDTLMLVVENTFLEAINAVEKSVGGKIELCHVPSGGSQGYLMELSSAHLGNCHFLLNCSAALIRQIQNIPDWMISEPYTNKNTDREVHLDLKLIGPTFQIPADSFKNLRVGDGLLISLGNLNHIEGDLYCEGQLFGYASIINDTITLSGKVEMKQTPEQKSLLKKQKIDEVDQISVNIKIELARTRILIEDLRKIANNSVIPFDTPLPDVVDLYVGDDYFAKGKLMQIDQNIAIQITEIN